jgi:4-hydroxybenzoate polyprenyltransferase
VTAAPPRTGLGRFLEIQNLGLNLPFALAFFLAASAGSPSLEKFLLIVLAFVAARNAGHSFNRWADLDLDRRNPRTQQRALVTGERSPAFALTFAAVSAAVVIVAAYFLNPLAFLLAPVALAIVFGYSYTKRVTTFTTAFLGLVEAITPAAVYIAVLGRLPPAALIAVLGMLAWGTAFETIHSLGDLESDRVAGLFSIPVRLGRERSLTAVALFHGLALVLFGVYGLVSGFGVPFYAALGAMVAITAFADLRLQRDPRATRIPFQLHFLLSALFFVGVALAVFHVG